jgi:hypothetical protein
MDDDIQSISQASADLHSSRVAEYEVMHNISRPLSPINLVVSSRATQPSSPDKPLELSSSSLTSQSKRDEASHLDSHVTFSPTTSLTIRGTSQQSKNSNIHQFPSSQNRKGKPPTCNALVGVPETIKLKNRNYEHLEDHDLMKVSPLHTLHSETDPNHQRPFTALSTSPLLNLPPSLSKSFTQPALGYLEPKGELQRTKSHLFTDRKKLFRYNASVSPLERIARIEQDLVHVITTRKKKNRQRQTTATSAQRLASPFLKILPPTPKERPTLLSPSSSISVTSRSSTSLSNHKTIEVLFSTLPTTTTTTSQPQNDDQPPDLSSPLKNQQILLPMNSSLSIFSDVHSPSGGSLAGSLASPKSTTAAAFAVGAAAALQGSRGKYQRTFSLEDYSEQKVQQILKHEQHQHHLQQQGQGNKKQFHSTAPAQLTGKGEGLSLTSPSPFSQAMQTTHMDHSATTGARGGGGVRPKRDPSSYLTRDHRSDSADYKIYRLAENERHTVPSTDFGEETAGGVTRSSADEAEISFHYLKHKLLSTKDKVYDCGPEYYQRLYAAQEEREEQQRQRQEHQQHQQGEEVHRADLCRPPDDDPVNGITKIRPVSLSNEKEIEQQRLAQTMPSR